MYFGILLVATGIDEEEVRNPACAFPQQRGGFGASPREASLVTSLVKHTSVLGMRISPSVVSVLICPTSEAPGYLQTPKYIVLKTRNETRNNPNIRTSHCSIRHSLSRSFPLQVPRRTHFRNHRGSCTYLWRCRSSIKRRGFLQKSDPLHP